MSIIKHTDNLKLITYEGESIPTYLNDITHNMEILDKSIGGAIVEIPSIDARLESLEDDMTTTMSTLHEQGERLSTVEEQIKFLSPADLDDIRDRISTAEQNIISNAESVKYLEERISNDKNSIADNRASIEALSQQSTAANEELEKIKEQIKELESGGESSATDITELTEKVNNLIEQNKALVGEIDGLQASDLAQANQITALAEDTKDLEVRVARLEKGGGGGEIPDLSELKEQVDKNTANIATNKADIDSLNSDIYEHSQRIMTLEVNDETNAINIKSNMDRLDALEASQGETPDLTELEGKVETNTLAIAANSVNISSNTQRIKALEDSQGESPDLTELEGRVATNESAIAALQEKLKELAKRGLGVADLVSYEYEGTLKSTSGNNGYLNYPLADIPYPFENLVCCLVLRADNTYFFPIAISQEDIVILTTQRTNYTVKLYFMPTERVVEKVITNITKGTTSGSTQYYSIPVEELPPIEDIISMKIFTESFYSEVVRITNEMSTDNITTYGGVKGDIKKCVLKYVSRETPEEGA